MPNILGALSRNTGRLGSAVVPAAVTAGLTYASGGTINPATTPGFLALLGTVKAGAGGLAAREEEERQRKLAKRYRKDQGIANFASALSQGRITPEVMPRDPGVSGVGQFAQMVGQGASAAQAARTAKEAWQDREQQRKAREAALSEIAGSDEAARLRLQEQSELAQKEIDDALAIQSSLTPEQRAAGGFGTGTDRGVYVMPETTITAESPKEAPPLGFLTGLASAQRADRQLDIAANRNNPYAALRREELLRLQNQTKLTSLVLANPRAFQNLNENDQTEVLLGLHSTNDPTSIDFARSLTGKNLTPAQLEKLQASNNVLDSIRDITGIYRDVAQITVTKEGEITEEASFIPGTGGLGPVATPFNIPGSEDQRKINLLETQFDKLAGAMRGAVETGVMSKDDYDRWQKLMPNIYAVNQAGQYENFQFLTDQMSRSLNNERKSLLSAGYRLPFSEPVGFSADIEDVLRRAEQGDRDALQFLQYGRNLGIFGVE
jgi:hypothetical protein